MQRCFCKNVAFLRYLVKVGVRVEFSKTEGLFCKTSDDVRPETLYIYIRREGEIR